MLGTPSEGSQKPAVLSDGSLRCNLKALLLHIPPEDDPEPLPIRGGRKVLEVVGKVQNPSQAVF